MVTGLETLPTMLWSSSGRKWKLVRGLFIFIAAHKSSLAVAGSRYLPPDVAVWLPVSRPLTALQCNRPTPGDSLPPIPVEAFPSRGPLDVDGFFQQEFLRSPGPVDHRCVFPVDVVVASPGVLCNCRHLQRLGSAGILVFPQPGFQPPLGLANEGFPTVEISAKEAFVS